MAETLSALKDTMDTMNKMNGAKDESELDIVVAGDVVMMAEKKKDAEERTWVHLKENGISVKVAYDGASFF